TSVRQEPRRTSVKNPSVFAIEAPQPVFHFKIAASVERCAVDGHAPLQIIAMHTLGPAVACLLFHVPAGESKPSFVEEGAQFVWSGYPDHYRRGVCHRTEQPVALGPDVFEAAVLQNIVDEE